MNRHDTDALKELYDQNIDALYRFAYFKMQSHEEEILDILQEVFYKLWCEMLSWKKIENPRAYLYRMLWNKIIDFYRKNQPSSLDNEIENLGEKIVWEESKVENITHAKLEVEKIYKILAWLDEIDKDIFILRFVEEYSPSEIAEIYDQEINSITVKLHRLKRMIQKKLQTS